MFEGKLEGLGNALAIATVLTIAVIAALVMTGQIRFSRRKR